MEATDWAMEATDSAMVAWAMLCGRGRLRLSPASATAMGDLDTDWAMEAMDWAMQATDSAMVAWAMLCGRGRLRLSPSTTAVAAVDIVVAMAVDIAAMVAIVAVTARGLLRPSP